MLPKSLSIHPTKYLIKSANDSQIATECINNVDVNRSSNSLSIGCKFNGEIKPVIDIAGILYKALQLLDCVNGTRRII